MKRIDAHGTLKVLFAIFAVISITLTSITAINYSNVMDAKIKIPQNIRFEDIIIPEIVNESNDADISILFNITNPTNIDIYVYEISYLFYMNNLSDPMNLESSESWDPWAVGVGGWTLEVDRGIKVPSKGSKSIFSNMTVVGREEGTLPMTHLNVTDSEGKYHPLIIATVIFTFEHIDVQEVVGNIFFYSQEGIVPRPPGG
jgi:hypothetical protein